MMQSVQLSIADGPAVAALREALSRCCAWHVEAVESPDVSRPGVMVLDEQAFARLPLPLSNPEHVVLIARKETHDSQLAHAWEAGIVSVVSAEDPLDTILLAIMAAALRVEKPATFASSSEITPTSVKKSAPISPLKQSSRPIRCKTQ
jgi:hypothetical protein